MAKSIQLNLKLCSLFTQSNEVRSRWGSMDSHPVAKAKLGIEGTKLSTVSGLYGAAQLDISSLSPGEYILALTPDAGNALRTSGESVGPADGKPPDPPGWCRYRPLKIKVSLQSKGGQLAVTGAVPDEDMSHGSALLSPTALVIDWRPDWVACKHSGPRPNNIEPDLILIHRTAASTPGSSIDSFLQGGESSHYLVDLDGHVIKLVHESMIANHAGKSFWRGRNFLNGNSIGIEIVNEDGEFTASQYTAVIHLIKRIQKAYPRIGRHEIIGHGDVQIVSDNGLSAYMSGKSTVPSHDLTLYSRPGCPGVYFKWPLLEQEGLGSKADPSLFPDNEIFKEYEGFFKDNPNKKITSFNVTDNKFLKKDGSSYGVIALLQSELASLGYSVSKIYGQPPNGVYDLATQRAVDRFRRRYMPGAVPNNDDLSAIFDRVTAIALKRVLLDSRR